MAIYTLSMNYIDGVGNNQSHLHNVFLKFSNPESEHKVAIDKSQRLLSIYMQAANNNNDLHTWLDFMSRSKNRFEVINVDIPQSVSEEEAYLIVAKNTRPEKKIIVDSHQHYPGFEYQPECNKVVYDNCEITVLDKDEVYRELHLDAIIITRSQIQNTMKKKNNPWMAGSFYLVCTILAVVLPLILVIMNGWSLVALPFVIICGVLALVIIGALQLRNDDKFNEEAFLELMKLSLKRLVLLKFLKTNSLKKPDDPSVR